MTVDPRERVWTAIAAEHPEFTHEHDPFDDYAMVDTLVLGDSIAWKPFAGARVIDIGANAGVWTAHCALHGAKVAAYEPDPVTFDVLKGMLHRTGLLHLVTPEQSAVWTYTGRVAFEGSGQRGQSRNWACRNGAVQTLPRDLFTGNVATTIGLETVPCVAFDEAIGAAEWDCVKVDVEGGEFELLLTASDAALRRIRFLQVEFHNGWASDEIYTALLDKLHALFESSGAKNTEGEWTGRYHWANFKRSYELV